MGKRPVLPHRTLRFQVGMYNLSVPMGTYQAGTQTPFFPWRSRDQMSFLFLPAAPVAAAICHRAEPLPSVHSNSFAAGRIWHGHKGPLSVPEVEHTMQSFPLVTQLGFRSRVRNTPPMTVTHKPKHCPPPQHEILLPISCAAGQWRQGSGRCFWEPLILVTSTQTCCKDESERVPELSPLSPCTTFSTWTLQDHLNVRLSNFQVCSCLQEARNLADTSDFT